MLMNLLAGLLGLAFQILTKMSSLKKDFKVANEKFVPWQFFEDEIYYILSSVVAIMILSVVKEELLTYKPETEKYINCIFVAVGALGAFILSYLLGKTKARIRNIVDQKTDELDQLKSNQP